MTGINHFTRSLAVLASGLTMTLALGLFSTAAAQTAASQTISLEVNVEGDRNNAQALHAGTFVWASSTEFDSSPFASTGINQFLVNAEGGVGSNTNSPQSALQVNGYVQLSLVSGTPPAADCDAAAEHGRMKVDAVNKKLWVCTSTGWKSATLN